MSLNMGIRVPFHRIHSSSGWFSELLQLWYISIFPVSRISRLSEWEPALELKRNYLGSFYHLAFCLEQILEAKCSWLTSL